MRNIQKFLSNSDEKVTILNRSMMRDINGGYKCSISCPNGGSISCSGTRSCNAYATADGAEVICYDSNMWQFSSIAAC